MRPCIFTQLLPEGVFKTEISFNNHPKHSKAATLVQVMQRETESVQKLRGSLVSKSVKLCDLLYDTSGCVRRCSQVEKYCFTDYKYARGETDGGSKEKIAMV